MSSAQSFKSASKKPAPFSLRLTDKEKTKLLKRAKGEPLGAYIKSQLFNAAAKNTSVTKTDVATLLAILGSSDLARSMFCIAKAAEIGSLPVTPELTEELQCACADIRTIRIALVRLQGMRPK